MRRSLGVLVAMTLLTMPVVAGVSARPQQPRPPASSELATSTEVQASFASGSGANRLSVKVSTHGNLISFESPAGEEAVFAGEEGYVLCSGDGATVHGHDTGDTEAGFNPATFVQPNARAFPLTVTRNTTGGALQLRQVWSKPDAVGKRVILTMAVKNLSGATLNGVVLVRTGDFDIGTTGGDDKGARTGDSTWLWDDVWDGEGIIPTVGLMLTALSFATPHSPSVEPREERTGLPNFTRDQCYGYAPNETLEEDDYAMRMIYHLGSLSPGQSRTVKLVYARM